MTGREGLAGRLRARRRRLIALLGLLALGTLGLLCASCFAGVAQLTPARLLATLLPGL